MQLGGIWLGPLRIAGVEMAAWRRAVALSFLGLGLFSAPAASQHVLVCYTLHNDLANFDRRAHSVDHYFMAEIKEARAAAEAADSSFCISEECKRQAQRDIERYRYLLKVRSRSIFGGNDPVRQRILAQMRYFRCPPEGDWYARDAGSAETGAAPLK
jgi:hypothetical protein